MPFLWSFGDVSFESDSGGGASCAPGAGQTSATADVYVVCSSCLFLLFVRVSLLALLEVSEVALLRVSLLALVSEVALVLEVALVSVVALMGTAKK